MSQSTSNSKIARLLSWLKRRWYITLPTCFVLIVLYYFFGRSSSEEYASAVVQKGLFRIEQTETGIIRAVKSASIVAPKSQTSLQIIQMIPEGSTVKEGDQLLQFDPTELQKKIDDKSAELEIAQANLTKFRSEMESNKAKAKGDIETAEAQYKQAQLRLSQMEFEAEVKKEEERLAQRQAEIAFAQARARIAAQLASDSAEARTLELKIKQAELELDKARKDLSELSITAKQPGLVVYQEIWKGNNMSKVQVGDQPWRGMSLLEIPDLSKMEVKIEVNEVDVAKIAKNLSAKIVLDAFPDPPFRGTVTDVSVLARRRDNDPEVKVFDVVVGIDTISAQMKPGMTATVTILADSIPDAIFVPIDAVAADTSSYVWRLTRTGAEQVFVKLGKRNDDFVVVESGLQPGDRVRLLSTKKKTKSDEAEKPTSPTPANGKSTTRRVIIRG